MKKTALLLLPIAAAGGLLASCNLNAGGSTVSGLGGTENPHSIYAFEAATSIGLLSQVGDVSPTLNALKANAQTDLGQEIASYLPSVEAALFGSDILTGIETFPSDLPEYETKMVVTYSDSALLSSSFTMYFNETVKVDHDDDDEPWEQEEESYIEGIVKIGENSFPLRGEKEVDGDELEVGFTYMLSENTYISVQQEKEQGETEFEYTIYENGRKTYDYSLEVEDREVELKVRDKANLSNLTMEFSLFERDGTTYIRADIVANGSRESILYRKEILQSGEVSYVVVE